MAEQDNAQTITPTASDGDGRARGANITDGVFFAVPPSLPRGRHGLSRAEILAAHRERAMIAATELMASGGYRAAGVREISARASISRAAFYESFADKDACLYAAYDRFIHVLLEKLAAVHPDGGDWSDYVAAVITAYLATLQQDLVVARAFQVEMDGLGPTARRRRRDALIGLAHLIRDKQAEWAPQSPSSAPLSAYIGVVYAVRQLASDALDELDHPDLLGLVPDLLPWVARVVAEPRSD